MLHVAFSQFVSLRPAASCYVKEHFSADPALYTAVLLWAAAR